MNVSIETSWREVLQAEFDKPYFANIRASLISARNAGKIIYPPGPQIFNAFNSTPFDKVKVVIIGQDPYHGDGEAMGLCFSVPKNIKIPPSLQNIYKELKADLGLDPPAHGDLSAWAAQGVLLLNASLTVERNQANSHKGIGWYTFTDAVIRLLSEHRNHLVFMLWGNFAKQKKELIDTSRHLVLEAAHPSPLAGGAFFGCRHFSKANAYLATTGIDPVEWKII
ncbi:MAG: uracil-DNA glycosylase [Saprospiraceae bacterium]|nr:uracil-DNA glycosylase [Saprospiraceae bacterium]HMW37810.1 uracil-DNA glycosylase [Saprospiraceae bacterium]HMX87496.1 uracil-DNA glycosylase [Saprospiraceae bacterium]HMZ39626.1 uracil-DNA glycosylase [Saprospiraceae bacterium]HNA63741.1 uracil-DNA glycosylase [Saprospiraceae bacterium]